MTREERQEFTAELSRSFAAEYLRRAERAPETWTGDYYRKLLADVATECFSARRMTRAEVRDYNNDRTMICGL